MEGNRNVFKQLKYLVADVYDANTGGIRDESSGKYRLLREDAERLEIAKLFVSMLLNSNYFRLETKVYLLDRDATAEQVLSILKNEYGFDISLNNLYQIWHRDRDKFCRDFGENFFVNLTTYKDRDISNYREMIYNNMVDLDNSGIVKACSIDITSDKLVYELSEEEFTKFISKVRPYFKINMKKVRDSLNPDALAYLNYILTHEGINDIDRQRLEKLKKFSIKG